MTRILWSFLLFLILTACGQSKKEIHPQLCNMTESVYASVKIEPEGYYKAFAAMPGILAEVLVAEGDSLHEGQLIARIQAENVSLSQKDARMAADLATENYKGQANILRSLANELESVQEQYRQDSLNFSRQQRLWEQQIGSKVQMENAQLKADLGRHTLDRLKTGYRQKENELETGYKRALNAVQRSNSSLSDFEIRSRMDGMVYNVLKEEGELLGSMDAIASIGSREAFLIVMAIDEVDVVRVRSGQHVWITIDAYAGEVFEAIVARIIPVKDQQTQTFTVEAQFIDPPDVLYAGLSGEANIVLSDRSNVLTIPLDHLLAGNKVLTHEGEVEVQVGMRNLERVEITAGLDSSSVILKAE